MPNPYFPGFLELTDPESLMKRSDAMVILGSDDYCSPANPSDWVSGWAGMPVRYATRDGFTIYRPNSLRFLAAGWVMLDKNDVTIIGDCFVVKEDGQGSAPAVYNYPNTSYGLLDPGAQVGRRVSSLLNDGGIWEIWRLLCNVAPDGTQPSGHGAIPMNKIFSEPIGLP